MLPVAQIEREIAPVEVAVFNIGANVRLGIAETTAQVCRKVWEMGCFAGFHAWTHEVDLRPWMEPW